MNNFGAYGDSSNRGGFLKKFSAFLLSCVMILTLFPLSNVASAEDSGDSDLSHFVQNVSIQENGIEDNGTTWEVIQRGNVYTLTLSFMEGDASNQFGENTLSYTLPEGITVTSLPEYLDITSNTSEGSNIIKNNSLSLSPDKKTITLTLNKSDENFSQYQASPNTQLYMTFDVVFSNDDNEGQQLDFGNGVIKTAKIKGSSNVSVSKQDSTGYNPSDGKVHYTLKVTSDGISNGIKVEDALNQDSILNLDKDSIKVRDSATSITSSTVNDKDFSLTLGEMKEGQTVYIDYTATPTIPEGAKIENGEIDANSTNTVNVIYDDNDKSDNTDKYTVEKIKASSISKWGNTQMENGVPKLDSEGNATIDWTVTVNPEKSLSIKGEPITDTLSDGQTLVEGSFKVKVNGGDAQTISSTDSRLSIQEGKWVFTPNDDGANTYEISYQTKKNVKDATGTITVRNDVSYKYGKTDAAAYINIKPGPSIVTKKWNQKNSTDDKLAWDITLTIPANTTYSDLYVDDLFPNKNIEKSDGTWATVYEGLTEDNITVTGPSGVTLNWQKVTSDDDTKKARIQFYQDSSKQFKGYKNETASDQTITITLYTKVDSDWKTWSESIGADWAFMHENNVEVYKGTPTPDKAKDTATIKSSKIEKEGERIDDVVDASGNKYPVYKYLVKISPVNSDSVTIEDTLPEGFTLYSEKKNSSNDKETVPAITFRGGDEWGNQQEAESDSTKITAPIPNDSNKVTFTLTPGKNSSGNYYPKYYLTYYVIPKDATALKALNQKVYEARYPSDASKASSDSIEIVNSATYDKKTAKKTLTYTYSDDELF